MIIINRSFETGERMNSSMKMIRSFDHDVYTVNVTKVSLSAYDDKTTYSG